MSFRFLWLSKTSAQPAVIVLKLAPKISFLCSRKTTDYGLPAKNLEEGDEILEECQVGCTACARCAMDAPKGLIAMENNLPVVDYSRNHNTKDPIQRCPTGSIVWIDDKLGAIKGPKSKKIIRKGDRPVASS